MLMVSGGCIRVKEDGFCPLSRIFFWCTIGFCSLYPKDSTFESGTTAIAGYIKRFSSPFTIFWVSRAFSCGQVEVDGNRIGHKRVAVHAEGLSQTTVICINNIDTGCAVTAPVCSKMNSIIFAGGLVVDRA